MARTAPRVGEQRLRVRPAGRHSAVADETSFLPGLERMLDYEMRAAARYRRFTSLVMLWAQAPRCNIHRLLLDEIRSSDAYFDNGASGGAILMGETDSCGALSAINRFRASTAGAVDLRFAIASYPSDARDAREMLAVAQRRLYSAQTAREPGAVVCGD